MEVAAISQINTARIKVLVIKKKSRCLRLGLQTTCMSLALARGWGRHVRVSPVLGYGTWPKILKEKPGKALQHPLLKKASCPMTKG